MSPPLPSVLDTRHAGNGRRVEHAVADDAEAALPLGDQQAPVGEKDEAPRVRQPLVTTVTRILAASAVSNTNGPAPSGGTGRPTRGSC